MHVLSWKKCREFAETYEDALEPLRTWHKLIAHTEWNEPPTLQQVRATFGKSVDKVGECYVFDIHGNHYRLNAKPSPTWKCLFILYILTHKEYDRENWKKCC